MEEIVIANSNPVFGVELRGFEHIPEAERNMTLRQVGLLWLGNNLNLCCIIVGCLAVKVGLDLRWAFAACVVGNLPYLYLALASIETVRAGLPVTTLSRAFFGVRGNAPNAFLAWVSSLAFEVINTIFGVFALLALFDLLGWRHSTTSGKLIAVAIQLVLGGGIAMLGHATMVLLQRCFALFLGLVLLVVLCYTCGRVDWSAIDVAREPLAATTQIAAFITACGILAFQPIGYLSNGPDWVRYLPEKTPASAIVSRVFWWTYLPSVVITAMGAMWATLGDMSDPVSGLKPFIPVWLYVAYIVATIGGSLANNVPTFYSSGLTLQSLGLKVKRWAATGIDVLISTAIVIYILFVEDFTTALNNFVALLLVWVGPYSGVWLCGGIASRWIDSPTAVHAAMGRAGVYGWISMLAGMVVAALTVKSPLYEGPVSRWLGGMDLSWIFGLLVSAATYAVFLGIGARRLSTAQLGTADYSTN